MFLNLREIERKFLIENRDVVDMMLPQNYFVITQTYIKSGWIEKRLRKMDDKFFVTTKVGFGKVRLEKENPISQKRYDKLLKKAIFPSIKKHRYLVELNDGLTAEIDEYQDELVGLIVAEVEFASESQSNQFVPLVWMQKEVTYDKNYKNCNLAKKLKIDAN